MPNIFSDISLTRLITLFDLLFENSALATTTDQTYVFLKKYHKLLMCVHDYKKLRDIFFDLLFENNIDFEALNLLDVIKEIIFILYYI
jgi:hypothetical protein